MWPLTKTVCGWPNHYAALGRKLLSICIFVFSCHHKGRIEKFDVHILGNGIYTVPYNSKKVFTPALFPVEGFKISCKTNEFPFSFVIDIASKWPFSHRLQFSFSLKEFFALSVKILHEESILIFFMSSVHLWRKKLKKNVLTGELIELPNPPNKLSH